LEALKVLALCALVGCGRIGFGAVDVHGDGLADGAAIDVATQPTCLGGGAFTSITPVASVNDGNMQYGSFISPDGLALLFDQPSGSANKERIFLASRPDLTADFGVPTIVTDLADSNTESDSDSTITGDGLELYFESDRSARCVYEATRTSATLPFTPPSRLDALCVNNGAGGPGISADGLTLVYNSTLDSFDEGDIYVSERANRGDAWPVGVMVSGIEANSGYAVLSADKLRLYYEHETNGGLELRFASRTTTNGGFTTAPISELDTSTTNGDISVTLDESIVAFSSSRAGSYDVYTATRPCLSSP
jgi:WD40-like Beta Propeller Repeat